LSELLYTIRLLGIRMTKSWSAGLSALHCVVASPSALIQASHLIGRHCQCTRSLGIATSDGSLSFSPRQGSLGGKGGTSEQHGEQDIKHKAHAITPSWLFGLAVSMFRLGSPS
jgi:hypothetical protein